MDPRCLSIIATLVLLLGTHTQLHAELPEYDKPTPNQMRAHYIDVGQGSAVLLEFSCGTALIDTGGEKHDHFDSTARLIDYLDDYFARRDDLDSTIDLLLLTHAHIDHTRGVPTVLVRYRVNHLVDNGLETGSGGRQQKLAHKKAKERGSKLKYFAVSEGQVTSQRGLTNATIDPINCRGTDPEFHVLWGAIKRAQGWSASAIKNGNNSSVVLRLDFGATSFLFPGDLEDEVQGSLIEFFADNCGSPPCPLDIDVYHVSHHGSHNGTSTELVTAMTPRFAVISMGKWNRRQPWTAYAYGHPRQDVIKALLDATDGVQELRPPRTVMVARRAASMRNSRATREAQFSRMTMNRAIYGTGWDGTVVVNASANGVTGVDIENAASPGDFE